MLIFLHQSKKQHSVERRAVIVFAKHNIPASFRQKKAEIFKFFRNRFDIPHCRLLFFNFDALFLQTYLEDPSVFCLAALATY